MNKIIKWGVTFTLVGTIITTSTIMLFQKHQITTTQVEKNVDIIDQLKEKISHNQAEIQNNKTRITQLESLINTLEINTENISNISSANIAQIKDFYEQTKLEHSNSEWTRLNPNRPKIKELDIFKAKNSDKPKTTFQLQVAALRQYNQDLKTYVISLETKANTLSTYLEKWNQFAKEIIANDKNLWDEFSKFTNNIDLNTDPTNLITHFKSALTKIAQERKELLQEQNEIETGLKSLKIKVEEIMSKNRQTLNLLNQ